MSKVPLPFNTLLLKCLAETLNSVSFLKIVEIFKAQTTLCFLFNHIDIIIASLHA